MITKDKFRQVTNIVIDKLEGGYYHPQMLLDGRVKDSRYGSSGETMFGIDRNYLGNPRNGQAQKDFWQIIDNVNARKLWHWNYMGGDLNVKLKELASDIIYDSYLNYSQKYLSEKSQKIVNSDARLVFHFSYATWNGVSWFKKFASDINNAVENRTTNPDKLVQVALDSRTKEGLTKGSKPNSLIMQGGNKIMGFIEDFKTGNKLGLFFLKKTWQTTTGKIAIIGIPILIIGLTTFLVLINSKSK